MATKRRKPTRRQAQGRKGASRQAEPPPQPTFDAADPERYAEESAAACAFLRRSSPSAATTPGAVDLKSLIEFWCAYPYWRALGGRQAVQDFMAATDVLRSLAEQRGINSHPLDLAASTYEGIAPGPFARWTCDIEQPGETWPPGPLDALLAYEGLYEADAEDEQLLNRAMEIFGRLEVAAAVGRREAPAANETPGDERLHIPCTLDEFMKRFCVYVSISKRKQLADKLKSRGRKFSKKNPLHIELPPPVGNPVRGQAHLYKPQDLKRRWHNYRQTIRDLPSLKPPA